MLLYLNKFISSFIMMYITIYIWYKLLNINIFFVSSKNVFYALILSIISITNYYIVNNYIKVFSITIILIVFFQFIFKENIQKSIITPIFTQLIVMISEGLFAIFVSIILQIDTDSLLMNHASAFITNLIITLIFFVILNLSFVKKIYNYLIKITNKLTSNGIIVISMIVILIANVLSGILYYKIDFIYMMIINISVILICYSMVLYTLKTKNNYIEINEKYNSTLNSLKEYEEILDKYRLLNHENKNQLLSIRGMLKSENKNVISYIDKIIENKCKDNDKAMKDVSKIPTGGLRGLIYSKIILMKSLGIDYKIIISRDVNTSDLIQIDDNLMLDICRIIGVYIDNSIEAVEHLNKKNINLEMDVIDRELYISISNNYYGNIEIEKIDKKGYSTKGNGHGYGLTLTREIINNNKKLRNEKRINKNVFTQTLIIKIKKNWRQNK